MDPTFQCPHITADQRPLVADFCLTAISSGSQPTAVTRDLSSNVRTLLGISCGTFQTDNPAKGPSLSAPRSQGNRDVVIYSNTTPGR
jgi:hypothetical protein